MKITTQRYLLLLSQLQEEMHGEHGWKAKAAQKLGVTPALVSFILDGNRGVGGSTIVKAIQRLGLDSAFFYDEALGASPHYRDHIAARIEREEETPPWIVEFLERYGVRKQITDRERARLLMTFTRDGGPVSDNTLLSRLDDMRREAELLADSEMWHKQQAKLKELTEAGEGRYATRDWVKKVR